MTYREETLRFLRICHDALAMLARHPDDAVYSIQYMGAWETLGLEPNPPWGMILDHFHTRDDFGYFPGDECDYISSAHAKDSVKLEIGWLEVELGASIKMNWKEVGF